MAARRVRSGPPGRKERNETWHELATVTAWLMLAIGGAFALFGSVLIYLGLVLLQDAG